MPERAVIVITGIQAAGKSTVAQLLAESLPRSVHLRGDVFRKMIVSGRAGMTPDAPAEAVRQLRLRHRLTAAAADLYFEAGFTVVAQDVILGEHLAGLVAAIRSPAVARRGARPAARCGRSPRDRPGQDRLRPVHRRPARRGAAPRDPPHRPLARHQPSRARPRPWPRSWPGPGPMAA